MRYATNRKYIDREALRKKEIAAIHVLKTQAAMTDDEYRAMLQGVAGKTSAADLDDAGRRRVLDHFARLGVKSTARMRRDRVGGDRRVLLSKIDALLKAANRDRQYLQSMVKRITGADALEFCDPIRLQKLVVALTLDADRHGRYYPR